MAHRLTVLLVSLGMCAVESVNGQATSKRGAAYNDLATVTTLSRNGVISWAYNWASSASGNLPTGVEFVPMLWGAKGIDGWQASAQQAISDGSEYILGFNEPDRPDQANMDPSKAADLYSEYITPLHDQAKLISPAVSSSTSPGDGLEWLKAFMHACSSCKISGLAVHWYGNSADEFKLFVRKAIDLSRTLSLSEVWITEFGLSADIGGLVDEGTTSEFIKTVTPWLDSQAIVTRYSYFMCAEGYLLDGTLLNSAGDTYISPSQSGGSAQPTTSKNLCDGSA